MEYRDEVSRATKVGKVRRGFYIHLTAYVVVNVLLIAINLATSPKYLWFVWALLGWGIGILAHALVTFALPRGTDMKQG
jgi:hypothetical protein